MIRTRTLRSGWRSFDHPRRADVRARLVELNPELAVIWTRHRREPDLVPSICAWFESAGFVREWLSGEQHRYGVGVHRYGQAPRPLTTGQRLFTFTR